MPSGWPSAMAPPRVLILGSSSARPSSRVQASAWAENASLSSMTSIARPESGRVAAAVSCVAGTGPMPMIRGGTPATAMPSTRAFGSELVSASGPASEASSSAAAPSLMPDALPAVTVPSGNSGLNVARASRARYPAGARPCRRSAGSFLRCGTLTGVISPREPAVLLRGRGLSPGSRGRTCPGPRG